MTQDVIFNEIEFTSGDILDTDSEETSSEIIIENSSIVDLVVADPFFMGMRIGGVAVIISLGTAVIIHIFKRLSSTV